MRRFVLVCLIVLAAAYAVGVPLFLLRRRRCAARGRRRGRRAGRARQPLAGRTDARRRRDRADARRLCDARWRGGSASAVLQLGARGRRVRLSRAVLHARRGAGDQRARRTPRAGTRSSSSPPSYDLFSPSGSSGAAVTFASPSTASSSRGGARGRRPARVGEVRRRRDRPARLLSRPAAIVAAMVDEELPRSRTRSSSSSSTRFASASPARASSSASS